ncbi:hypothetical protein [Herbaspirillum sp. RV1423]|uniref:hypothetical protein n=1 Tax=Herbaspirillum sp. RV1423 TaxID=1443993 RepID=UPI0018CC1C5E|nr:hypothetical protein [Herbaspirillum sp. RV1423]
MRFKRLERYEFHDTERKRKAYARKQKREIERYPLFPEMIAAEQKDVDSEMTFRRDRWNRQEVVDRARRAVSWRQAREKMATYPDQVKAELLAYWKRCGWPGDPSYLASLMRMFDDGRLDLKPQVFEQTEAQREAVRKTIQRLHERAEAKRKQDNK